MLIATIIFALLGIVAGAFFGMAIPGTTITGLKLAMIYFPALATGTIAGVVGIGLAFAGFGIFATAIALSTIAFSLIGSLLGYLWARFYC